MSEPGVQPVKSKPSKKTVSPTSGAGIPAFIRVPVEWVGAPVVTFITQLGDLVLFTGKVFFWMPRRPWRISELFRHMKEIGFGSLFIVILTGFFSGMVFGLQTLFGFRRFGAEAMVGPATLLSLAREMGPVLAALMVAGRSGSGMATELGTMRVTEQIDALSTLAVEPVQYLVVPRVIAATLMLPLLCSVYTGTGFFGSYVMAVLREGVDPGVFLHETWTALDPPDFYEGYIKSAVFGFQIALISCFKGFNTSGGARGVGEAATAAVVLSSVSILVGTYLLTEVLHQFLYGYIYFNAMPQ
ncbi:MAG: ABC transporter permease [Deltaproteobacteria bacterium]|nr:ABC transporter permease [Deltaproteobacteria bacterium]